MVELNITRDKRIRLVALCCSLLALFGTSTISLAASEEQPTEYEVKAAFLYKFVLFVKWPPQKAGAPESPFVIGVFGKDPFSGALAAAVEGKKFNEHPLIVRQVSGAAEARKCHLLFISRSEDNRLPAIARELRDTPVLTVGESEKFIARGGMINFITVDNKVHFEINPEAAGQAGLRIHSQLLHLARVVTNRETADLR
jgi:hypothetical protein